MPRPARIGALPASSGTAAREKGGADELTRLERGAKSSAGPGPGTASSTRAGATETPSPDAPDTNDGHVRRAGAGALVSSCWGLTREGKMSRSTSAPSTKAPLSAPPPGALERAPTETAVVRVGGSADAVTTGSADGSRATASWSPLYSSSPSNPNPGTSLWAGLPLRCCCRGLSGCVARLLSSGERAGDVRGVPRSLAYPPRALGDAGAASMGGRPLRVAAVIAALGKCDAKGSACPRVAPWPG